MAEDAELLKTRAFWGRNGRIKLKLYDTFTWTTQPGLLTPLVALHAAPVGVLPVQVVATDRLFAVLIPAGIMLVTWAVTLLLVAVQLAVEGVVQTALFQVEPRTIA